MFARFRDENLTTSSGRELTTGSWVADRVEFLTLKDGRRLAWSEYGHRHGYPLLYLHREAGSRIEANLFHESASAAGFRLIAVDRPGIGDSDYTSLRAIKDQVGDYQQLLDHLQLNHIGIISWGGGSLLAVEIAKTLCQRVSMLNLISPWLPRAVVPTMRLLRGIAKALMRLVLSSRARRMKSNEEQFFLRWREQLCHADRQQIGNPRFRMLLTRIAGESIKNGSAGAAQDLILIYSQGSNTLDGVCVPVHEWTSNRGATLEWAAPDTQNLFFKHLVRCQGQLFVSFCAAEIFAAARQSLLLNSVGGDLRRR
jgi:pimeloyl-ACP methyl ester carboxylesterase